VRYKSQVVDKQQAFLLCVLCVIYRIYEGKRFVFMISLNQSKYMVGDQGSARPDTRARILGKHRARDKRDTEKKN